MTSKLITALSGVDEKNLQDVAHSKSCQDEQRCEGAHTKYAISLSNAPSKMRIKFLTLLTIICSLFILFGCTNPFEQPKAEKGSFSLAVNGVNTGRTILPSTVQNDFAAYTLEFFAEGETTNPVVSAERTSDDLDEPVILEVGTYDLIVTAYFDTAKEELAAQGSLTGIEIGAGAAVTGDVTLTAVIDDGEGTFSWDITFPAEVTTASMTITPLDAETGTAAQTVSFSGDPLAAAENSVTLNAGYYRVVINLGNAAGHTAVHREYLHVYKNMDSLFEYDFEGIPFAIVVTNGDNAGAGSLRQAITDVADGGVIIIDRDVGTITLTASLSISKSLTIEGNGVIITPSSPSSANFQLLGINSANVTVSISRVHFKDGRNDGTAGAAIGNSGTLSLESCIFSGNQKIDSSFDGGAITNSGPMSVKGCTFYGNSANRSGGAISSGGYSGTLMTLEGNLFYGNTAGERGPVVFNPSATGTITSLGYNVVDVALGTGNTQSGFAAADNETDTGNVSVIPVSPVSFKVLSGSGAAGVITELPADYPAIDFYGNAITAPAAAGAVQTVVNTGYVLVTSVNNSATGSISANPAPNADGLVPSGIVTITATPNSGYGLMYWLVNGGRNDSESPLSLSINEHTTVQAVFGKVIEVTDFTDSADGNGDTGTLRLALNTAQDGDTIRFPSVTAGTSVIELVRALPSITGSKSLTIEGNGITITLSSSSSATSSLLRIEANAMVNISRVHFKNGNANSGGAIYNNNGNLSLESCIFSDNQATANNYGGGAVYNYGTMNVKGCTFYNNTAPYGGAIYTGGSGTLTLEGNLFYGNTATARGPGVFRSGGDYVTSLGYNVIDVTYFGEASAQALDSSGFVAASNGTDKRLADLLTSNTTSPFVDAAGGNFAPVSDIKVIDDALPDGYPVKDFFGNDREIPWAAGAVK